MYLVSITLSYTPTQSIVKFIYSEKATKFFEIFTLLTSVCTVDKSKVKVLQNFVAFSEYMNFISRNVLINNISNKIVTHLETAAIHHFDQSDWSKPSRKSLLLI